MSAGAPLGRSFHGLWMSTGAANLGDGVALFALPLMALAAGASAGGVAAVTVALTLAWPVVGLHAGWLVDRVDRRQLVIGVNLVRGGVLAVLTVSVLAGELSLPLVLAAAALLGIAETLVDTALTAIVPMVVGTADRTRANARLEATVNVANQLVGPPLAGALAGIALSAATGAGTALYLLAAGGLLAVAVSSPSAGQVVAPDRRDPAGTGFAAGMRYLWRHRVLRMLTLFTAAMNVVWAAALSLLVVYAVDPGPLRLSPAGYGLILTAMAAGGLAVSMVVDRLRRRFGVTRLLIADCVGTVLLVLPVAAGAHAVLVAAGAVVAGAGAAVWRILVATLRQDLAPPELLGRIYAASRVISWGVLPAGAALAGLAAEIWSIRAVFAMATGLAVLTFVGFVGFALRNDLSLASPAPVPDRSA